MMRLETVFSINHLCVHPAYTYRHHFGNLWFNFLTLLSFNLIESGWRKFKLDFRLEIFFLKKNVFLRMELFLRMIYLTLFCSLRRTLREKIFPEILSAPKFVTMETRLNESSDIFVCIPSPQKIYFHQ